MTKRKKDRQYNGQKKKGQIIQWPKEKRTDNTMAKRRTDNTMAKRKKDKGTNNDLERATQN